MRLKSSISEENRSGMIDCKMPKTHLPTPGGRVAGEGSTLDLRTGEARADSIAVDPAAPSEAGMIGLSAAPDTVELMILRLPLLKLFIPDALPRPTPRA